MMVRIFCTLLILTLLSRPAAAHGAEILITVYLQLAAVAACIIISCFFTKSWGDRFLIAGLVLLAVMAVWLIFGDRPYTDTKVLVNILSVGFPVLGLVVAMFIISVRNKKRGTSR